MPEGGSRGQKLHKLDKDGYFQLVREDVELPIHSLQLP